MNYFAHLVLAEPTAASRFGNLLGDFCHGVDLATLPLAVQAAVARHRAIDRFTDASPEVRQARQLFSARYRRFAPVITDVLWDHLLLVHWPQLDDRPLQPLCDDIYQQLWQQRPLMPKKMAATVTALIEQNWFGHYQQLAGIGGALDNIAKRLRFSNQFAGSLTEIEQQLLPLTQLFLQFYPKLRQQVIDWGPELTVCYPVDSDIGSDAGSD